MDYYDKLGIAIDEGIRMKLFVRSLDGKAFIWYARQDPRKWHNLTDMDKDFINQFRFNIYLTLDRPHMKELRKKRTESF